MTGGPPAGRELAVSGPRAPLRVRPAEPADAVALGALHVRAWQEAYRGVMPDAYLDALSAAQRAELWARALAEPGPGTELLVATRGGAALGFAAVGPARRPPPGPRELYALNVDPPSYRTGVGAALLRAFEDWARGQGAASAVLWVVRENARARAFYQRRGWHPDGAEARSEVLGAVVTEVCYRRAL